MRAKKKRNGHWEIHRKGVLRSYFRGKLHGRSIYLEDYQTFLSGTIFHYRMDSIVGHMKLIRTSGMKLDTRNSSNLYSGISYDNS